MVEGAMGCQRRYVSYAYPGEYITGTGSTTLQLAQVGSIAPGNVMLHLDTTGCDAVAERLLRGAGQS